MLEQIWDGILQLTSKLVIPDWGALIALLPIGIAVLVAIILVWTFRRLRKAAPARRGKRPLTPRTPAGIHMPGPSMAPFFAAVGAFLLFLGLVFGGPILVLGAVALGLTLLYWLSEALRVYDREQGGTVPQLPAAIHDGPPPGVHMPGPSFRPFFGALGTFFLFLGLVFGGWLLAAGVVVLILTLFGWLIDALKEYDKTVQADATGHLENIPRPRMPRALLWAITIVVAIGFVVQVGWLPPSGASGGTPTGSPGASGAPGGSGAPPAGSGAPGGSAAPGGSGAPAPGGGGGTGGVKLTAQNVAFVETSLTLPAAKPFGLAFDNEDAGTPHNVEIKDAGGTVVFKGEVFNGVKTTIYQVPALTAGSYTFLCIVHPSMTGTATAQ